MSECMCPVERYGDVDNNRRVCHQHKSTVYCILCDGQCPACEAEWQQLEAAIIASDEDELPTGGVQ